MNRKITFPQDNSKPFKREILPNIKLVLFKTET